VLGVRAEDANHALTLDHLALRANLLHRWTNLHLFSISRILPRERSLSESSTPTRLPATSRTKWVPRRSATWARTLTPFSSSTRYIPLGRASRTRPSTTSGGPGTSGYCTGNVARSNCNAPARAVRGGQHARAVLGDGDGVLEVGRQRAVGGAHGPAVGLDVDVGRALIDHR